MNLSQYWIHMNLIIDLSPNFEIFGKNGDHLFENNSMEKIYEFFLIKLFMFVFQWRIETNIWLYTNRANISWPITIGFIWPSVLEQMSSGVSSTPIILDFQVIAINITKVNCLFKLIFNFLSIGLDTKCDYNKSIVWSSHLFRWTF
jgi:hypothetical protein